MSHQLKTAKALGLDVPATLLTRADEVTNAAIAEQRKFSALLKMLRAGVA